MVCRLALAKEQTGREAHINNSFLLLFRWDGQSSCASVVGDWCACPDLSDRTFRFTAPENCHRSAKIRTNFSQTLVSRFCSADTFKSPENTFYSFPSVLFIITFCEREKEKMDGENPRQWFFSSVESDSVELKFDRISCDTNYFVWFKSESGFPLQVKKSLEIQFIVQSAVE